MIKIYRTSLGNLSTSVVVEGVPQRVHFYAHDGVNGLFSTDDEALQRALEQSRGYGKRFTLLEGSKAQPEPETYTLVPGHTLVAGCPGLFEKGTVWTYRRGGLYPDSD